MTIAGTVRAVATLTGGALIAGFLAQVGTGTANAAPLIDCVSSDNGDPVLTAVTFSPTAIDVSSGPKRVTVTLSAHDTGGPGPAVGLRHFFVSVVDPRDSYIPVHVAATSVGHWAGTFTVPKWGAAGRWGIAQIILRDRNGQEAWYGADDQPIPNDPVLTVTSRRDPSPPTLTAFSFTPTTVDTTRKGQYVHFTARAIDNQTGVPYVGVLLAPRVLGDEEDIAFASLHKVKGTAHRYRGRTLMRRWIATGQWRVWYVVPVNGTGRYGVYSYRALGKLGFTRDVLVRSGQDSTAPRLEAFRLTPSAIDLRQHAQSVTIRVRTSDTGSGLKSVHVMPGVAADFDVTLRLVSGTRHDGVWEGTLRFPRCPAVSGTWKASVQLADRRDNNAFYPTARLTRLGWQPKLTVTAAPDSLPPVAHLRRTVAVAGPVNLTFDEAVNGIRASSALVRQSGVVTGGPAGPALEGHWDCLNRSGATTDCVTGRVRTATFTPVDPLTPGTYYEAVLNPEHSLEVTSMAGYPFDRDLFLFVTDGGTPRQLQAGTGQLRGPRQLIRPDDTPNCRSQLINLEASAHLPFPLSCQGQHTERQAP